MQGRSGVLSLSDSGSSGRTARADGARAFCAGKVDVFDIVTVRGAAAPQPQPLTRRRLGRASFPCGARCCVPQGPVGKLSRVRVGHDGSGFSPSWSLSQPRSQHCSDLRGDAHAARMCAGTESAVPCRRFVEALSVKSAGGTTVHFEACLWFAESCADAKAWHTTPTHHYPILLADPSAAATVPPVLPAAEPIHESDSACQPHLCTAQYEASQAVRACVRGRSSYAISSRCTLARQQKMKSRTS